MSVPRVTAVRPPSAIEGGRITFEGSGFPIDEAHQPRVRLAELNARVVYASPTRVTAVVPVGLEGGPTPVHVTDGNEVNPAVVVSPQSAATVDIAAPIATISTVAADCGETTTAGLTSFPSVT